MLNYIIRRLLLMIPTIFGITFMVFMLIALSPGGLTAGVQVSQGDAQDPEQGGAAVVEAYLEDRYGLGQPAAVQYLRWLSRISPLKFGVREQWGKGSERLASPRPLRTPEVLEAGWLPVEFDLESPPSAEALVRAELTEIDPQALSSLDETALRAAYEHAKTGYANARGRFIRLGKRIEIVAVNYAEEAGLERAVVSDSEVRFPRLVDAGFDTDNPHAEELIGLGEQLASAYALAKFARERELEVFMERPYPNIGVGVDGLWLGPPDLGKSFTRGESVTSLIARSLPVTLLINVIVIPIVYLVAVPSGVLAAVKKDTLIDRAIGVLYVALWSLPRVGVAVVALGFLSRESQMARFGLPRLPTGGLHSPGAEDMLFLPSFTEEGFQLGWLGDSMVHLILPVACTVYTGFAILSKQARAAMLENFNADFVRTARAKGVPNNDVVFRHVFRNSLLPLITMFVSIFPALLAGSIVIEQIFTIEGMGKLGIDAIYRRDREVLLGVTLIVTIVNLLALLLADILYALADPRVSYD